MPLNESVKKWNYEACYEEAKKYKNQEEMYRENRAFYNYMVNRGLKKRMFSKYKIQNISRKK